MLSFLTSIWDTIKNLVLFVANIVSSLFRFIGMIPQYTGYVTGLFAWLPAPFFIFGMLALSITVILVLLGRNT